MLWTFEWSISPPLMLMLYYQLFADTFRGLRRGRHPESVLEQVAGRHRHRFTYAGIGSCTKRLEVSLESVRRRILRKHN